MSRVDEKPFFFRSLYIMVVIIRSTLTLKNANNMYVKYEKANKTI